MIDFTFHSAVPEHITKAAEDGVVYVLGTTGLTEEEQAYYRRGKNSHTHAAPKAASAKDYAKATGLECLFGALYLLGRTQRLGELFAMMMEE